MPTIFTDIISQTSAWCHTINAATQSMQDFTRRLELILSQDHKKIAIRDTAFSADFTHFCTQLRKDTDQTVHYWQQIRQELRTQLHTGHKPSSLQHKSFTLRAKALSRACDKFTYAYDTFNNRYQNYTLTKLPVWVLTACCEDINTWSGKILFLTRELSKYIQHQGEN